MSGRKNVLLPFKVESAKSLSSSFTTTPTVINYLDNCSYQINIITSDSEGTFSIQGSIDYAPATPLQPGVTGNWADITLGGGTPTVAAASDTILIDLNQLPFAAIRVQYTSSVAGTGICDIYILAKQVGG